MLFLCACVCVYARKEGQLHILAFCVCVRVVIAVWPIGNARAHVICIFAQNYMGNGNTKCEIRRDEHFPERL